MWKKAERTKLVSAKAKEETGEFRGSEGEIARKQRVTTSGRVGGQAEGRA